MLNSFTEEILFGTASGVEGFIRSGADMDEIDEYGYSPLIEATIANKLEIVALLLNHGADVNKPDVTGRTALHWAVDNHNLPLCRLLLEHQANANAYTTAGQPVLVYPLLREQKQLKSLLYYYGAKLSFAQDFIQAKLLGHRYELSGQVDIVNSENCYIEVDYEGFFLEFTLDVILHSLKRYRNHFSSRHFRSGFLPLKKLIQAFSNAQELLKYQRYTIDIKAYEASVHVLLDQEILLLPLAYEGHAIALIKYKNWLVYCDRSENKDDKTRIRVYQIHYPYAWTDELVQDLLYFRQSREFFNSLHRLLGLALRITLPIEKQRVGNCSWANLEAVIPAVLFLVQSNDNSDRLENWNQFMAPALRFYKDWKTWDQERALEECMQGFFYHNKARQASKATLLAAILFQRLTQDLTDLRQAEAILKILTSTDYRYLLKSYLKIYWEQSQTQQGKSFIALLDLCGVDLKELD